MLAGLRQLNLPEGSYSYFIEVSNVRFWFHDEEARQAITQFLSAMSNGRLVKSGEMRRFGVPLEDDTFGELFFYLDPGCIFFPHDFHHPLANFAQGLADPMQRSRLRDPRHKGNHGHLPEFDAENAFLAVFQDGVEVRAGSASILDVAPSILSLLGYDQPPSMTGRPIFNRCEVLSTCGL